MLTQSRQICTPEGQEWRVMFEVMASGVLELREYLSNYLSNSATWEHRKSMPAVGGTAAGWLMFLGSS